jgi:hypothetical protein
MENSHVDDQAEFTMFRDSTGAAIAAWQDDGKLE